MGMAVQAGLGMVRAKIMTLRGRFVNYAKYVVKDMRISRIPRLQLERSEVSSIRMVWPLMLASGEPRSGLLLILNLGGCWSQRRGQGRGLWRNRISSIIPYLAAKHSSTSMISYSSTCASFQSQYGCLAHGSKIVCIMETMAEKYTRAMKARTKD
jgi:hypothetical protein